MILLDTNVVIRLLNNDKVVASWYSDQYHKKTVFCISSIAAAELLALPSLTSGELSRIEHYFETVHVIPVSLQIAKQAAAYKRSVKLRLQDAVMAATAKLYGMALATADRDFDKLSELSVIRI